MFEFPLVLGAPFVCLVTVAVTFAATASFFVAFLVVIGLVTATFLVSVFSADLDFFPIEVFVVLAVVARVLALVVFVI
jgi:hypothetical protein